MNPQTSQPQSHIASGSPWAGLVERIRQGKPEAMEELYQVFSQGVRFLLYRQLGPQDLDDKLHDIFLIVAQSISNGDLREPDRLMSYVRTVVRRQVAGYIGDAIQARRNYAGLEERLVLADRGSDPEHAAIEHENEEVAMRILNSIGKRDREVLIRFYLDEQTPEQICQSMNLTETQFRLIKSRAKARFGEMGKRRFSLRRGFRR
jgi:RNA polymerase sigma-70 factor, ECF subfamily